MEYFILWLCSIASSVHNMFMVVGIFGIVGCFIYWGIRAEDYDDARPKTRWIVLATLSLLLSVCIPSTPNCYMIFGVGKTLEYVTSSDEVKKLPDNAVKAINYYLEGIPEHNHKNHNDSIQNN